VVDPLINSRACILHHSVLGRMILGRSGLVTLIIHVLNLEIDKFKLEHGRRPCVMRLGRKQMASLLALDEAFGVHKSEGINYRNIPVEQVDEDWHLVVA
jgi:hypothetical protein